MSFNIALSGIRAASQDLEVTGNNIANASTNGFKGSRTEFGDVYTSSVGSSGTLAVGSGVRVQNIAQQFGEGNISFTDNLLDLAISGTGFFVTSTNGEQGFTRSGTFGVDEEGFVVNNTNGRLQGFGVDANGTLTNLISDIEVSSDNLQPQTTQQVRTEVNLDSREAPPQTAFIVPSARIADLDNDGATITVTNPQGVEVSLNLSTAGAGDDNAASVSAILNNALGVDSQVNANNDVEVILNEGYKLSVNPEVAGAPALDVSTTTALGIGFNPLDSATFNHTTPTIIFDSLGNSHVLQQYFIKQPYNPANTAVQPSNAWQVVSLIDGQNVGAATVPADPIGTATAQVQNLYFSPNGSFDDVASDDINIVNWTPLDGSGGAIGAVGPLPAGAAIGAEGSNFNVSLTGSSQVSGEFEVRAGSQDGTTTGRLAGLNINDEGVLVARYTNGQNRDLAQIALADFANAQGLSPTGNTSWSETSDSGVPLIGPPGTASLGFIESGALEDSNVDLSEQLVNLIIAQRNFQANSKTIETADSVTQTILNIR
ncbi:MAG: flagellar hook protein FlgE [Pseudohongiellaceae bacterium]|jgi:flagellar hook protein FlgE